jgi:hypothetical protein
MELDLSSCDWASQKAFLVPIKGPLWVKFKQRNLSVPEAW